MDSVVISISLPIEMLRRLDEAAAADYQTRSGFVRNAINNKIKAQSKQRDEEKEFDDYLRSLIKAPKF